LKCEKAGSIKEPAFSHAVRAGDQATGIGSLSLSDRADDPPRQAPPEGADASSVAPA
jgi:hypothetical protein